MWATRPVLQPRSVQSGQESSHGVAVGEGVWPCPADTYRAPEVLTELWVLLQGKEVTIEGVQVKVEVNRVQLLTSTGSRGSEVQPNRLGVRNRLLVFRTKLVVAVETGGQPD